MTSAHRREESERNTQKIDRHILHNQIGGADNGLLAGNRFCLGHRQIEVGMIRIAGGVLTVGDVDRVVLHLLDLESLQITISIAGCHPPDPGLLRIDVVIDRIHLIGSCRTVGKLGTCRFSGNRIIPSVRENELLIHVDLHVIPFQILVLIGDIALFVDIDPFVADIVDQRVLILSGDRILQKRLVGGGVLTKRVASALLFDSQNILHRAAFDHHRRVGLDEYRIDHRRIGRQRIRLLHRSKHPAAIYIATKNQLPEGNQTDEDEEDIFYFF